VVVFDESWEMVDGGIFAVTTQVQRLIYVGICWLYTDSEPWGALCRVEEGATITLSTVSFEPPDSLGRRGPGRGWTGILVSQRRTRSVTPRPRPRLIRG
jgi:hypothetical protein